MTQTQLMKKYCPFCKEETTYNKIEICEHCFNATLLKEKYQKLEVNTK